jgi:hypothetical protein
MGGWSSMNKVEGCFAGGNIKVVADKENGEYRCECKQWEHTGMMSLV